MKIIVLSKGFGDGCDYTIGCNKDWRIEDFDGTLEEASCFYKNQGLYNGDEDGKPDDYNRITEMEGQLEELIVLPYEGAIHINMDKARDEHNTYWDLREEHIKEENDRVEYERLSKKFTI